MLIRDLKLDPAEMRLMPADYVKRLADSIQANGLQRPEEIHIVDGVVKRGRYLVQALAVLGVKSL